MTVIFLNTILEKEWNEMCIYYNLYVGDQGTQQELKLQANSSNSTSIRTSVFPSPNMKSIQAHKPHKITTWELIHQKKRIQMLQLQPSEPRKNIHPPRVKTQKKRNGGEKQDPH